MPARGGGCPCLILQAEVAQQLGEQNPPGSVQSYLSAQPRQGPCELLLAPYDPHSSSRRAGAPGPLLLGQPFPECAGGWLISANPVQLKIALNQTSGKLCATGLCRKELKMILLGNQGV